MNIMELNQQDSCVTTTGDTIQVPLGLLGFEQVKSYSLLFKPDEEPFLWFQMNEGGRQAFLVVSPFLVVPEYQPDISKDDVEFLELRSPEDSLLLNIVTLRKDGKATINLKGPIIINRRSLIGKQVIPNNASQYALNHPLPVS